MIAVLAAEPDPSWFYSSLAQSSAAVVGFVGAFLIFRIQDQALRASTGDGLRLVRFELERYLRSHPDTTATYATTDARKRRR